MGVIVLMLTACSNLTAPSMVNNPPANLMQPCPDLPILTASTGSDVLLWSVQTVYLYRDCAARHQGLIDAIRQPE
ncbi:Rz1-like lysis system protein LysC [Wielerella bovis]|uniref:Rz1-like lysis system protein LysC n=1 Tax=Wielerella bovis TaxID=2917790 RepID=UPI002019FDDC|nr:hypothetical protein [Wielerella bovis]ULJ60770.1 hypothetical protein MIS44_02600 [Wielerella bovis]